MSTWAKLQQTIGELRTELNLVQVTTAKLDAALAERADKARKYTSTNGAVELNLGTGGLKMSRLAMGALPSDPQMITVTAGEWSESDLPSNAIERYKFIGDQLMKIPAEHRDSAEFSTEDISFDRDGSDIRTTLTYRRLETDQEAAERAVRQSGSGVTINADGVTIMANGKVVVRLGRCMDDEQPAEQPFAVKDDQVFVGQALVEQFATKAQISEEASARASADEALATHISAPITSLPSEGYGGMEAAERVRQVIREELKPGGMLHRV
ncbi:hypothetical protein NJF54_20030 [Pseudomonas guariconensis]|uniref:hypothetical protein n=1 Tax=Pseudomonas guariconensis TaxID=1288410 RepID=UPI00209BA541|nr:hypothetical protein [Pseudomonas guariconensis]MCO7634114.1 hypothetical protein [Pseudomonas guariconensis]